MSDSGPVRYLSHLCLTRRTVGRFLDFYTNSSPLRGGHEGSYPSQVEAGVTRVPPASRYRTLLGSTSFTASGRLSNHSNSRSNTNLIILLFSYGVRITSPSPGEDCVLAVCISLGFMKPEKKYFAFWNINLGSVPLRTTFLVAMK